MLGVLFCRRLGNVAPYLGAHAVAMTGPPWGEAQPFANIVLAVGDRIAGVAINDKTLLTAGS